MNKLTKFFWIPVLLAIGCSNTSQNKAKELATSIQKDIQKTGKNLGKLESEAEKKTKKAGNDLQKETKKGLKNIKKTKDTVIKKLGF